MSKNANGKIKVKTATLTRPSRAISLLAAFILPALDAINRLAN